MIICQLSKKKHDNININCHRCKIIWRHLVLLITIQWCSFTVQNPKLRTYQMLAWYGNWLSHNVGRFYRQTSPHAGEPNKARPFCPLWGPLVKSNIPLLKGRSLSSSEALWRSKSLHSESEAVQRLAEPLLSSLW